MTAQQVFRQQELDQKLQVYYLQVDRRLSLTLLRPGVWSLLKRTCAPWTGFFTRSPMQDQMLRTLWTERRR